MSAPTTRIALIQMSCAPSTAQNLDHAADLVREAARSGAQIVCLPELFRAQYFCQREDHALFALAESIPGPSTARLAAIVREQKITLIASLFERRAPGLYHNTAAVLDHASDAPDNIVGIYRKMHIPDDPLYYEKFYFTPGDLGFKSIPTSNGSVGTLICWDQWYPEAARLTALHGRRDPLLPHSDRLAPQREGRVRRSAVLRLADHAARSRHLQRRLRCRGQPRRPRARRRHPRWRNHRRPRRPHACLRPGVLGRQLHRRPVWPHPRAGFARQGRDSRSPTSTRPWSRSRASTGPSCATGASTPTAASPAASSTNPRRLSNAASTAPWPPCRA